MERLKDHGHQEQQPAGRSLCRQVPRSSHGSWTPRPDRPDPSGLLQERGKGRLEYSLAVKYALVETKARSGNCAYGLDSPEGDGQGLTDSAKADRLDGTTIGRHLI
jgi:hypothetical protein